MSVTHKILLDVDQYADDLDSIGINHPAPGMLGAAICQVLEDGKPPDYVAAYMYRADTEAQSSARSITLSQAQMAVAYEIQDICPGAVTR